jgi:undecaprenyl phosphate-alpha-L-ara4N flippase subunit ArnE
MKTRKVTLKLLSFLILTDLLETFTQFCFKKSALLQGSFYINKLSDIYPFLKVIFFSSYLWIGFISVFLTFGIWSTILSKIDLSVAVPIASFSYILVPLVSIIFLHEQVSLLDWTGIFFILIGVIFVSLSTEKGEPAHK